MVPSLTGDAEVSSEAEIDFDGRWMVLPIGDTGDSKLLAPTVAFDTESLSHRRCIFGRAEKHRFDAAFRWRNFSVCVFQCLNDRTCPLGEVSLFVETGIEINAAGVDVVVEGSQAEPIPSKRLAFWCR